MFAGLRILDRRLWSIDRPEDSERLENSNRNARRWSGARLLRSLHAYHQRVNTTPSRSTSNFYSLLTQSVRKLDYERDGSDAFLRFFTRSRLIFTANKFFFKFFCFFRSTVEVKGERRLNNCRSHTSYSLEHVSTDISYVWRIFAHRLNEMRNYRALSAFEDVPTFALISLRTDDLLSKL